MKDKLASLLLIGGALFSVAFSRHDPIQWITLFLGAFFLGFSFMLFTAVTSGTIWGIRIRSSSRSKFNTAFSALGLFWGGYSVILLIFLVITGLSTGKLVTIPIALVGYVLLMLGGLFVAKKIADRGLAKENTALFLGQIPLFAEIDNNIEQAIHFVVGFEGVALFSATNYCYAVYLYEDYQLGTLSTPKEVALVGTYFVQRYHKEFTYKVDHEVIPGTPGQTVVAVGTGGIGVARIKGTSDKRIFRSYIFAKKLR